MDSFGKPHQVCCGNIITYCTTSFNITNVPPATYLMELISFSKFIGTIPLIWISISPNVGISVVQLTITEPKREAILFKQPQKVPDLSRLRSQESSAYGTESSDPLEGVRNKSQKMLVAASDAMNRYCQNIETLMD